MRWNSASSLALVAVACTAPQVSRAYLNGGPGLWPSRSQGHGITDQEGGVGRVRSIKPLSVAAGGGQHEPRHHHHNKQTEEALYEEESNNPLRASPNSPESTPDVLDWFHEEEPQVNKPSEALPFLIQPGGKSKALRLDVDLPLKDIKISDIDDDMLMLNTRSEVQLARMKRETDILKEIMEQIEAEEKQVLPENEAPSFPPQGLVFAEPTPEEVEEDKKIVRHLHKQYYQHIRDKNVLGLMTLWREEGSMQGLHFYYGEDKVLHGRQEIKNQHSTKFTVKWAQPQVRLNFLSVDDEVVAVRGLTAWTTAKETWENQKTKEKKVLMATKIFSKSNGAWKMIQQHVGECEVKKDEQQQQQAQGVRVGALGGGSNGLNVLGMGNLNDLSMLGGQNGQQQIRTIITPEGQKIVISGLGNLGNLFGGLNSEAKQKRDHQETKDMLAKALLEEIKSGGGKEIMQIGSKSKGQELFSSGGSRSGSKKDATVNLTKKTLDAIRQLWSSGQLSLAQKTKLIYSVVRSTKEEEVSEVERAYELLVENEDTPSMDDFAEQCRIVAEKEDEESDDDFDDDFDDDD